jgi:hypothetical protein
MDIIVNWKIIFAIILLIILSILLYLYRLYLHRNKNSFTDPFTDSFTDSFNMNTVPKCVCAFDIDHTISCGNPKPFVDMCKQYGCILALNTARPVKYVDDVDLNSINFTSPHFDDSDFYYNPNSYSQTAENVAEVKATFLNLLNDKYNINNKKCVILLDDNRTNINIANKHGFGTIKAKASRNKDCGLSILDLDKFENNLNYCNNN